MSSDTGLDSGAFGAQAPPTPVNIVQKIARDHYAVDGRAVVLSSERDETFLVQQAGSTTRFVLKIAHPAELPAALQFQTDALLHLEAHAPSLPVPRAIRPLHGPAIFPLSLADGSRRLVRMLSFLDGIQLYKTEATPAQMRSLGEALAALQAGLARFEAPALDGKLLWDLAHATDLKPLLVHVDDSHRAQVSAILDEQAAINLAALPAQIIHNDFNPYNLLVDERAPERIAGIFDFGDLVRGPLVHDIAIAASYQIGKPGGLSLVSALLQGYGRLRQLTDEELAVLPGRIRTRLAMTIIISEWRSALLPTKGAYIKRNHPAALAGLAALAKHSDIALAVMFERAGRSLR